MSAASTAGNQTFAIGSDTDGDYERNDRAQRLVTYPVRIVKSAALDQS